MGNCCADVVVAAAGCGGILLEEVAFAETAVKWWRSFSFFIAFAMMIEVGGGGVANLYLDVDAIWIQSWTTEVLFISVAFE